MNITFNSLADSDMQLLLKWLTTPHVKEYWDKEIDWKPELIKEKFGSYLEGYKIQDGKHKPIYSYIIYADNNPIGYIQLYNAYDFPRKNPLVDLPESLVAFDIFIGDPDYINNGVGSMVMKIFIENYCQNYDAIFVDPDISNIAAITAYKKAGFKQIKKKEEEMWMIREIK